MLNIDRLKHIDRLQCDRLVNYPIKRLFIIGYIDIQ